MLKSGWGCLVSLLESKDQNQGVGLDGLLFRVPGEEFISKRSHDVGRTFPLNCRTEICISLLAVS